MVFSKAQANAIQAYIQVHWGAHMAISATVQVARALGQRVLAANGPIGISFVWASGQWWHLGKPSEHRNRFSLTFGKVSSVTLNTLACW